MIEQLRSLRIPDDVPIARSAIIPESHRKDFFNEQYDFKTIAYDCISLPKSKSIVLVCPKLFNLEGLLEAATFKSGGSVCRIRKIRKYRLYDEVWLSCRRVADSIEMEGNGFAIKSKLSNQEHQGFSGLNVAVTISKDNSLAWIADWAQYHVVEHGLEAVVLFDNSSEKYEAHDIVQALRHVSGLRKHMVISAPFPFGPRGKRPHHSSALFLQSAALNIARYRFLRTAGAVLNADIDELVYKPGGGSIFAYTRRTWLGYLSFEGDWYIPDKSCTNPSHRDHVYRLANKRPCPSKWCINPRGLLRGQAWHVHRVGKRFLSRWAGDASFRYQHCWSINTNWKGHRKINRRHKAQKDPAAVQRLKRVFRR